MAAGADRSRTIDIAVFGASGRVGRRVLELIGEQDASWRAAGCRPRVVAVANSRQAAVAGCGAGLAPAVAVDRLLAAPPAPDASAALAGDLGRGAPAAQVVVDCTASDAVAREYPRWLGAGSDVVTPNKIASSGDARLLQAIRAAERAGGTHLYDATTVGAQLPLLATLRDLQRAGDRVERVEAVLSGTLSYVLGRIDRGAALSVAVREAVQTGYAEPNPANDLSGEDAARKLVILLRALGREIELADVDRVALVDDEHLREPDPARLLHGLAAADAGWRARAALAQARHERWVYRASFEDGRARVAPERVGADHAFARLAPCENALILHSAFYRAAPLTIAGPGAGIDLTAAGVFADLVDAAQRRVAAQARAAGLDARERTATPVEEAA